MKHNDPVRLMNFPCSGLSYIENLLLNDSMIEKRRPVVGRCYMIPKRSCKDSKDITLLLKRKIKFLLPSENEMQIF